MKLDIRSVHESNYFNNKSLKNLSTWKTKFGNPLYTDGEYIVKYVHHTGLFMELGSDIQYVITAFFYENHPFLKTAHKQATVIHMGLSERNRDVFCKGLKEDILMFDCFYSIHKLLEFKDSNRNKVTDLFWFKPGKSDFGDNLYKEHVLIFKEDLLKDLINEEYLLI